MKKGELLAMLVVQASGRCDWREHDLNLIEETAERTWAAIERAKVAAALRKSEERLRRVLENDAVGVLFFDRDGYVFDSNPAFLKMTGYTRAQVERRELHSRQMTPPEWLEVAEEQMRILSRTGRIGPYEKQYLMADGSRRWMLFAGRDIGDGTIAEHFIDITERKRAEEALRDELAAITRLHDLSERLLSIGDLPTALGEVLDAAMLQYGADRGTVQFHDPEENVVRYAATRGFDPGATV